MKMEHLSLFTNIVRWRIQKENHAKQFEVWREMLDYQKAHPEKVNYIRSRFFTFTEEGSPEEGWMALDEYERREDFDKAMSKFNSDAEFAKFTDEWFPKWEALIVPKSRRHEYWDEVDELRVEFK